jgi:hypothetical protein
MKITVQLVVYDDDDHQDTFTREVVLEKACQRIKEVGLTLAEAKALLSALQQQIVERQAATFPAICRHCQICSTPLRTKGQHTITLFGTITLTSPRLRRCPCTPHETATLNPLTAL